MSKSCLDSGCGCLATFKTLLIFLNFFEKISSNFYALCITVGSLFLFPIKHCFPYELILYAVKGKKGKRNHLFI